MKALDLFCSAGGAGMGLHRAGYEVTGVDIEEQPNYPFAFTQADALEIDLEGFDLVWASPPCQAYGSMRSLHPDKSYPDLIAPVRERLEKLDCQTIIENVVGAPMRADVMLCGSMFGLTVRRHRLFEVSFPPPLSPPCDHSGRIAGVYGNPHGKRGAWKGMLPSTEAVWKTSMGIDWMTCGEMTQAIPPAYSQFLAESIASN